MKKNLATWKMSERLSYSFRRHSEFGKIKKFPRGSNLYSQGDIDNSFYFINSGYVRISILHDSGQEVLLEVMGPDTLCGDGAAFDGMPRFSSAQAMTDVDAIAFKPQDIAQILRKDPDFGLDLLQAVAEKQRIVAVKVGMAPLDSDQRVLEFLSRQALIFGEDSPEGCVIKNTLTHEQIAALTGASRVTITRTLLKLRKSGAIKYSNGYYILP